MALSTRGLSARRLFNSLFERACARRTNSTSREQCITLPKAPDRHGLMSRNSLKTSLRSQIIEGALSLSASRRRMTSPPASRPLKVSFLQAKSNVFARL